MQYALQLFTEVEVASDGYLPLTTDTKVNSCFSIYYSTAQKDNSKTFILATITIVFGRKSRASCSEVNRNGYIYSELE